MSLPTGSAIRNWYNVSGSGRQKYAGLIWFEGGGGIWLTYPLIWLKLTSLSSTASVLRDGRILIEIISFYSKSWKDGADQLQQQDGLDRSDTLKTWIDQIKCVPKKVDWGFSIFC